MNFWRFAGTSVENDFLKMNLKYQNMFFIGPDILQVI